MAHTARSLSSAAPEGSKGAPTAALPPFLDECLRGVGQVVFCNSATSGALIAGALCLGDPWLASLAAVGTMSATATARLAGLDEAATKAGLFGYNGALVGCAFSVFLGAQAEPTLVATVLGGAASALVASKLGPMTAPVPQWTLAFNAVTLAALAYVRPLADVATVATPAAALAASSVNLPSAVLTGVSQIFVVNSPAAGALMLAGIAAYSPGAALATMVGSFVGVLTAIAWGADGQEVEDGLWGFNPALTALSVSIFFVPTGAPYLALACGGAAATAVLTVGMKAVVAGTIASPCLTLPFCAVASGCFLLAGRAPGLVRAAAPHSPEVNLRSVRAA